MIGIEEQVKLYHKKASDKSRRWDILRDNGFDLFNQLMSLKTQKVAGIFQIKRDLKGMTPKVWCGP